MNLSSILNECKDLPEVFEVVKKAVNLFLGKRRAGLMLGLADLPLRLAAFYIVGSNIIVVNENIYDMVRMDNPEITNIWSFRILLHEYLHSLGYLTESEVRRLVRDISLSVLGKNHLPSIISKEMIKKYFPLGYTPRRTRFSDLNIKIVEGFERSNTKYIT